MATGAHTKAGRSRFGALDRAAASCTTTTTTKTRATAQRPHSSNRRRSPQQHYVHVDDVALVKVVESQNQLCKDALRLGKAQAATWRLRNVVVEVAAEGALHHEKHAAAKLELVVQRHDVRMRGVAQQLGLVESQRPCAALGHGRHVNLLDDHRQRCGPAAGFGQVDDAAERAVESALDHVTKFAQS